MAGILPEVLYEIRCHASGPSSLSCHSQQPLNETFLSLISLPGISQLKEKWSKYTHTRKVNKWVSLFISPRGERVAVAVGKQITILHKRDDYKKPCGVFTSNDSGLFVYGSWSESHDILGVVDDSDTLHFIKGSGEVIIRLTKKQLKVSVSVIGIIFPDDNDKRHTCLCSFNVLTSDGFLHHIEISKKPSSVSNIKNSNKHLILKNQFPNNVFCLDYYQERSLLIIVGNASSVTVTSNVNSGLCYLSVWHRSKDLELDPLLSIQFEGLFSKPKSYAGSLTSPKVLMSPKGKFVATLDVRGSLAIFKLDVDCSSLSKISFVKGFDSQVASNMSNEVSNQLNDITDFVWWSDHILTLANMSGFITMIDIIKGNKLLENDVVYSMPVLERVHHYQGNFFLLENTLSEGRPAVGNPNEMGVSYHKHLVSDDRFNHLDIARLRWSLISFSERSIPEMYSILIGDKKYQAALDFADSHGLAKDEAYKSQWLYSNQGVHEIKLFLSNIKDHAFILSECVEKIGQTEDAMKALLTYGLRVSDRYRLSDIKDQESDQVWDFRVERLKLLQFKDRLDTLLGINMGRFSVQEYKNFRIIPINEAAVTLAESGKIGALNLLFKRHPYSLAPSMLKILSAVPETVPVKTYDQLLPGRLPPNIFLREKDWVECDEMVNYIQGFSVNHEVAIQIRTEPIVQHLTGFLWPSVDELCVWYKKRAMDIDTYSGQLDNCLYLLDSACRKNICELQQFRQDISYLHQLVYSDGNDEIKFTMNLVLWEGMSDYEKFKTMLKDVKEEVIVEALLNKAIPFLRNRFSDMTLISKGVVDIHLIEGQGNTKSYLVKWLKEIAPDKLDTCLMVIEEGCKEFQNNGIFKDESEAVCCALDCIYLSTSIDRWNTMTAILSKLPQILGSELSSEGLCRKMKKAEGHIEAGRLLAFYQVPKPLSFFLDVNSDGKGIKQILRLMLSKFVRRQPGRSDNDWANMWRDMQCLHEKAFPFLDLEYMLVEFCRGLLKAGKFSLARNYLKGSGSVAFSPEKAENLVIQAAREYFFSASSLACSEIWKANECLNLFPSNRNVKAEANIIDAITIKLPDLGVTILPLQFRQIKDPMEIIKMAITSQPGAYLHVDELIEIAKLLGMSSSDDISSVQEAIAREAAIAGDLYLAFDLCLVLVKKGHGLIWDLCAAIARGPYLENMGVSSRKKLLGFALSHCDDESIGELLHAWKELDMQGQCEKLMILTGTNPPNSLVKGSSIISLPVHSIQDIVNLTDRESESVEVQFNNIKDILCLVAKNLPVENKPDLESLLLENGKVLSFAAFQLPWLLELTRKTEREKKLCFGSSFGQHNVNVRAQAVLSILSWLARNGFAPRDDLIAFLAKSILEPPVTEDEDVIACAFLLNISDAFNGVEIIEEQFRERENYQEISHIMNVGMIYSFLHNSEAESKGPAHRRELMLRKFREKHLPLSSDEINKIDKTHFTFWKEWKFKLEEQKCVADRSRVLQEIIPGVETARFLSGDFNYIQHMVFSLIESLKFEKRHILRDVLRLADVYGLNRNEVLLGYLRSILVSEVWSNDDIIAEISDFQDEIFTSVGSIKTISSIVYPEINGCNKQRLAYIYELLSECYLKSGKSNELIQGSTIQLINFYKLIEQQCIRVSFIKTLNFKNIAGLGGLNIECFSSEVYNHIDEYSLEPLAKMVETIVCTYDGPLCKSLISWQDVYKHYVLTLLASLENKFELVINKGIPENLQSIIIELEQVYGLCIRYIRLIAYSDALTIMKRYFTVITHCSGFPEGLVNNSTRQDCLVMLINFWIRLSEDMQDITPDESSHEQHKFNPEYFMKCIKGFMKLVVEKTVSTNQGWATITRYMSDGIVGRVVGTEIFIFSRSMIFSGCGFGPVLEVFSEVVALSNDNENIWHLYVQILELILQDLGSEIYDWQNLHYLLSSLSEVGGELEELNTARHAVWERMVKFSHDLTLPNHVRVYALELMQCISGNNIKGMLPRQQFNVEQWKEWDEFLFTNENSGRTSNDKPNDHREYRNILVALKSSQLAATISPSIEITPDEFLTVETALSCYSKLCVSANSASHIDALVAILIEWDGIFVSEKVEVLAVEVSSDEGKDWNNDVWDEGWESFQESPEEEKKSESPVSPHPLHACWMEILKKMIAFDQFTEILNLIDRSHSKSIVLLDEHDANTLSDIVLEIDCFAAVKISLLLPYEAIRFKCLDVVEAKLNREGIPNVAMRDHSFLILTLSSGVVSNILTRPSYGTTFSYLCYLVGNLSRDSQEAELLKSRNIKALSVFKKVIFPCFLSELVKADQQILAGFLVTKFMHTNASLALVNVAESSLKRFLESRLQECQAYGLALEGGLSSSETLINTLSLLRGNLGSLIRSALLSLN